MRWFFKLTRYHQWNYDGETELTTGFKSFLEAGDTMPTITCAGLFFSDFWIASGTAYPPNEYPVESINQWLGSLALKGQNILKIYYLYESKLDSQLFTQKI